MVQIEDLAVGTVAGLIAAGVFIVNFLVPMIFPLVMVGGLKPENSAATWSVVGRTLHNSQWPSILRSDTAGSNGVRAGVRLISWFQTLLLLLVGIASIVTPLGLYETITPRNDLQEVDFSYTEDSSPMTQGTLPRNEDFGLSRSCWGVKPSVCIWSDTVITETSNSTTYVADLPDGYDVRIPRNITEIYSAGLSKMSKTISSAFDIQWRTYKKVLQTKFQRAGQSYLVGDYRQLSQMVLNDAWEAIVGLVVNTKTGGVGFRNHTAPPQLPFGSTWSEELLFIEPETECVDLNITMDFKIPESEDETESVVDVSITDRGGFANVNREIPWYDTNKTWENANLRDRAYFAAWFSNVYTMFYLNVTNPKNEKFSKRFEYLDSTIGKKFKMKADGYIGFTPAYDMLMIKEYGTFLNMPDLASNGSVESNSNYPNPWEISADNFTDIAPACANSMDNYRANITNIAVQCGMILGAARRSDGSPSLLFDPGTEWTVPLYSCASAAKASIKSVDFRYNGTAGLKSLEITSIVPKKYAKDEDKPLWAVENLSQRLRDGNPVWGITLPEHENHPNISTTRQEHLYLPGLSPLSSFIMGSGPANTVQNFAGIDFYARALTATYQLDAPNAMDTYAIPDYTGKTSLSMYKKWQSLSENSTTAASIINLIWTDISANAVVGTKSHLPSQPLKDLAKRDGPQTTVKVPVRIYTRHVKFHILYGIPAFLVVALVILILSMALFYILLGKATPSNMRRYLNQTSTGRILTTFLYTNDCPPNANRKEWVDRVGKKRVHLGGLHPRAMDATSGPALAPDQSISTAVASGAAGAAATTTTYGKMDEGTISMHSLPSPMPYSPVNHSDGAAQSYYNQESTTESPYTYVAPGSGMLSSNGAGYTEFRKGNASPRAL